MIIFSYAVYYIGKFSIYIIIAVNSNKYFIIDEICKYSE